MSPIFPRYGEIYGIPDAHSVYRGTLRYAGNSELMYGLRGQGLFDQTENNNLPATWGELTKDLRTEGGLEEPSPKVAGLMQWLGLTGKSGGDAVEQRGSVMDAFCAVLEEKLAYGPKERDMAVMHHEFGVTRADGGLEKRTSTYVRKTTGSISNDGCLHRPIDGWMDGWNLGSLLQTIAASCELAVCMKE